MRRFLIRLLEQLKALLATLMLIKYIISKEPEKYPPEFLTALEMSITQAGETVEYLDEGLRDREK